MILPSKLLSAFALTSILSFAWAVPDGEATMTTTTSSPPPVEGRQNLNATLWFQTAVERQAVTLAVYRSARDRLPAARRAVRQTASVEQAEAGDFARKPPAIVMDVDETVLDNSAFEAWQVRAGKSYEESAWAAWVSARRATAIPGAAAFIAKAHALGYRVVFITNRNCPAPDAAAAQTPQPQSQSRPQPRCPQKEDTLENLKSALGVTVAADDVMLRGERPEWSTSDKSARRLAVARTHRIAMLFGDDLNDFVPRAAYAPETQASRWGTQWFAIPNPMYGSWGDALGLAKRYDGLQPWEGPK